MKGFGPESFGDLYADEYDAFLGSSMDAQTRQSVEVLADLARGGPVLEFAIGTGRVALPLAARGFAVHGIEASEKMVAKMREKPGGEGIPVTIGDMSDARVEGRFTLVFLVFNTIFNLTSQEAQVRCFENAARHLTDDGVFLIETILPDLKDFESGQSVRGMQITADAARFEVRVHDPVTQTMDYQRIVISNDGTKLSPLAQRYTWPSEFDLMARLAGLELRDRWAWWDRTPFTSKSTSHVSIYGRSSK